MPAIGTTNYKACITLLLWTIAEAVLLSSPTLARGLTWQGLPDITMRGGLRAFWNVTDRTKEENEREALARGFEPVTLTLTFMDYPGNQNGNVYNFLGRRNPNPWTKPDFFERIVRQNIGLYGNRGLFVHDIEFQFEEDIKKAWQSPETRKASGAADFSSFEKAYLAEWATWFTLPAKWTKERYPDSVVGFYGPQPFRRDYYGIAGKDAQQIDGTHKSDAEMWRHFDPYVDYYVASIYVFYDRPDSVFYMASNVEENYLRSRVYGNKPVYAYTWLRFHDSNRLLKGTELPPYLVEAMAIVPYFSGAKGVVLWGYEPTLMPGQGRPYERLPHFMQSLARVAKLSEKIGRGKIAFQTPAHVAWKQRLPLVRRVDVGAGECITMAINPWQSASARSSVEATCNGQTFEIPLVGRSTAIAHIQDGRLTMH